MSEWHRVASTAEVAEGEAKAIEIMGLNLALYHIGGAWFCTDNECTHAFALLTDGWIDGHLVECPLHNGQFDLRSGKGQGSPIEEDLRTYQVKVEQDSVLVMIP